MDVDPPLMAALKAHVAFSAALTRPGQPDPDMFFGGVPKGRPLPHLTIHDIPSSNPDLEECLDGATGQTEWWRQLDIWAATKAQAREIRELLRAADGPIRLLKQPPLQASPGRRSGARETLQAPLGDGTAELFRASLDVQLWLTEAP